MDHMLGVVASGRGSDALFSSFRSAQLQIAAPRPVSKCLLPDQCSFNLIWFHFSSHCSAKSLHCPVSVMSRRYFGLRVDGTEEYPGEVEMEIDREALRDAAAAFPVPTGQYRFLVRFSNVEACKRAGERDYH